MPESGQEVPRGEMLDLLASRSPGPSTGPDTKEQTSAQPKARTEPGGKAWNTQDAKRKLQEKEGIWKLGMGTGLGLFGL